jgi:hypothetical protein
MGATAGLLCAGALAADWLPVTDAERGLKESRVEQGAAAEALFWHIDVVQKLDFIPQTTYANYIRIKLFTQYGCQTQGTVRLPASAAGTVSGRTVKPDGRVVDLGKDAISIRNVAAVRGLKINQIGFVLPALEPGDIIEYRWSETHYDFSWQVRLEFQLDIPVQHVRYSIRPVSPVSSDLVMLSSAMFQMEPPPPVKGSNGYYTVSMDNVAGYVEEPMMPPPAQTRPWMLLHYTAMKPSQMYWADAGRDLFGLTRRLSKSNDHVRRAAAEAIAEATDPEEKLARLARYCRAKIKNVAGDDITQRQREKAAENRTPSDTLKRGLGTTSDVRMLFLALASAAGFDARLARLADRSDIVFNPAMVDVNLLPLTAVAVKLGERWRFYDAAARELPPGMLPWQEQGVPALISDPEQAVFATTQPSGPEESVTSRTGTFELQEDGSIEGEVRLAYTGHSAAERRQALETESPAQREEDLKDDVRRQFESAEVSQVKIENIGDAEQPLAYSYRVKIPAYAQRTGKRLLLQLGYFERGQPARFASAQRRYPVFFDYAWTEQDRITVKVPEGYVLENAEAPGPVRLGEAGEYEATVLASAGKVVYRRKLAFGRGGRLISPVDLYPFLKHKFDAIHEQDQRVLTLRQTPPRAAHSVNPPSTVSAWPVM